MHDRILWHAKCQSALKHGSWGQILEYDRHALGARLECLKREAAESGETFAQEVARGLGRSPKSIPPKFFYDAAGSALFERICGIPEYPVWRTESQLLRAHAEEIISRIGDARRLVEFGSGASSKTRPILDAMGAERGIEYVPIDISDVIAENCRPLLDAYENLTVRGIVDTYERGMEVVAKMSPADTLIAFLGSSLGNMNLEESMAFLRTVRRSMRKGDAFLIGLDLVKDVRIMKNAYDDAAGITEKFNKNMLSRMNAELGADFDLNQFEHLVLYDEREMRISMHLRSMREQAVSVPKSGVRAEFKKGELLHTENSFKYTPEKIRRMLLQAGMRVEKTWTDGGNLFSLTLASAAP